MCKSCDCDNYEKCSIVDHLPIGHCCSQCNEYDEHKACVQEDENKPVLKEKILLLKSEIKGKILHVSIEKEGKVFDLKIDLNSYLK